MIEVTIWIATLIIMSYFVGLLIGFFGRISRGRR